MTIHRKFHDNQGNVISSFQYPEQGLDNIGEILRMCEVLIEKSAPRDKVWHHEAPPSDAKLLHKGHICRSVPHNRDRFLYYIFKAILMLFLVIFEDDKCGDFLRGDKSFRTIKRTKSRQKQNK